MLMKMCAFHDSSWMSECEPLMMQLADLEEDNAEKEIRCPDPCFRGVGTQRVPPSLSVESSSDLPNLSDNDDGTDPKSIPVK